MMYGIEENEWMAIKSLLAGNQRIERAILFGSRAKGCHKEFSDVDMTLVGDSLTDDDLLKLLSDIDDLLLPYEFDISIFNRLSDKEFTEHIRRAGITIYEKQKND